LFLLPSHPISTLFPYTTLFRSDFINNGNKIDLISLPENLIKIIYPSVAQGLTFLAAWISFVFLGHIIYTINLICNRNIPGIIVADRKSTRLNSSHVSISYAVFC